MPSSEAVIIVVGTVSDEGLRVSPLGNFNTSGRFPMRITDTKFSFILEIPDVLYFEDDYRDAAEILKELCDSVAKTENQRNLFASGDDEMSGIRFGKKMFVEKVGSNCRHYSRC